MCPVPAGLPNPELEEGYRAWAAGLGPIVMALTVALSFAAGLAFRRRFRGSGVVFCVAIARFIMPSIVVSLGI